MFDGYDIASVTYTRANTYKYINIRTQMEYMM